MSNFMTVTDTAKIIRKQLANAFPGVKFSVVSKSYSGGASIRVIWTDGPTVKMVEPVAKRYEGADFDGMTDYKGLNTHLYNGEVTHFGADYVFCEREYSLALWMQAINTVSKKYNLTQKIQLKQHTSDKGVTRYWMPYCDANNATPIINCGDTVGDLVNREMWAINAYGVAKYEQLEPAPIYIESH